MPRMRIAIVTRNGRHVGGAETYLSSVGRALCASGHDLALLHEVDVPADHAPLTIVDGIPRWCVADLGSRAAVNMLRQWAPDVIYAHGLADPAVEHAMLALAPVDRAAAHTDLAESYWKSGKNAEAKKQTLAALEIAPSYERAQDLLLKLVDGGRQ